MYLWKSLLRILQNPSTPPSKPPPVIIPFHARTPDKHVRVRPRRIPVPRLHPPHEEDDGEEEGDPDQHHAVGAAPGGVGGEVVAGHFLRMFFVVVLWFGCFGM